MGLKLHSENLYHAYQQLFMNFDLRRPSSEQTSRWTEVLVVVNASAVTGVARQREDWRGGKFGRPLLTSS
jgi:hypothetical protein